MTRDREPEGLVLFDSIHFVLTAEKLFNERSVECDLVPVPKSLRADCGMAIAFRRRDLDAVREMLSSRRCRVSAIYLRTGNGYEETGG